MNDAIEYLHRLRCGRLYLWPLTTILEGLMADVQQIQQDIAALQDAQVSAATELQTLADLVAQLKEAGADAITQDQLDTLHDNLQSVTSSLVAATQSAQTTSGQPVVNPLDE